MFDWRQIETADTIVLVNLRLKITTEIARRRIRRKKKQPLTIKKEGHCLNGHLRTEENTYIRSNGRRSCMVCRLNASKKYAAKKKAALDS